jgi:hypothetical protein
MNCKRFHSSYFFDSIVKLVNRIVISAASLQKQFGGQFPSRTKPYAGPMTSCIRRK